MVRFDDITPDMNWDNFYKGIDLLKEYGIKPLLGVVPCSQDKNLSYDEAKKTFWEELRQLQADGYQIAQHGYTHVYETEDSGLLGVNPFSEFAGLSYEKQYEKLRAGQAIFIENGIQSDIFMAPGHTYDENTLKALVALGFTALTDGLTRQPYRRRGICCIPCNLMKSKNNKYYHTICVHTNLLGESGLDDLNRELQESRQYLSDYQIPINQDCVAEYSSGIEKEEKQVLLKRIRRNQIASSTVLATYLQKTNHSNRIVKQAKRLVGLPVLVLQLLRKKES